jgi:hypothetical protein
MITSGIDHPAGYYFLENRMINKFVSFLKVITILYLLIALQIGAMLVIMGSSYKVSAQVAVSFPYAIWLNVEDGDKFRDWLRKN